MVVKSDIEIIDDIEKMAQLSSAAKDGWNGGKMAEDIEKMDPLSSVLIY